MNIYELILKFEINILFQGVVLGGKGRVFAEAHIGKKSASYYMEYDLSDEEYKKTAVGSVVRLVAAEIMRLENEK